MNTLDWIDVGPVSAERDENLKHYFYDAGISTKIMKNPRQFLLLGRKGAGKTALFRHLETRPSKLFGEKDLVVSMSLNSYSWRAHSLLANEQKGTSTSQRDSWRFVIAIESIRALVNDFNDKSRDLPEALKKANDVLERIFSKPIPSWLDLIGEKILRVTKVKAPNFGGIQDFSVDGGEVSFSDIESKTDLKSELSRNLENLTNYLEKVLTSTLSDHRVFMIFDRLDESWLPEDIKISKAIICGLIHASDHATSTYNGKIRPIVFLREDIFGTLEINDLNKLREDCGSTLMWQLDSLEGMLLERVNYFARLNNQPEITKIQELFDREIVRSRTTTVRYIYHRTLSRPRDLVAYMSKIIQDMKQTIESNPNSQNLSSKINTDSIYEGESSYSEYLFGELLDEWKTQVPDFEIYLGGFENIGQSVFTQEQYLTELQKKIDGLDRAKFRSILRFLFENSIIGFKVGKSTQWRFKCFQPNQAFQDTSEYKVHPGLKKRLGLKDPKGTGANDEDDDLQ